VRFRRCGTVVVLVAARFFVAVAGAVVDVLVALAAAAVDVGCWQSKHNLLFIALAPAATSTSTPHSAWMWRRHCGHLCVPGAMPPSTHRRPSAHGWLFMFVVVVFMFISHASSSTVLLVKVVRYY
jgi:hypothetical protein